MTAFWQILNFLFLGVTTVQAAPITDPYVKNLTLIGVIHVEGGKTRGQSVAVLREKQSGRTRILHKGDSLIEANLEVEAMAPQEITLVRGTQRFVLHVENQPETTAAIENVETVDVELKVEPTTQKTVPRFEPKVVQETVCEGDPCTVPASPPEGSPVPAPTTIPTP